MTSNIEYPISNIQKGISKPKGPPPMNIQYSVLDIRYSTSPLIDILDRLNTALADRYTIQDELGAGG